VGLRVYELEIDDWNADEAARHRVREAEIRQVLDNAPIFKPNKKGHKAPIVMIGPTFGGRFLTIPLSPTRDETVWRPATAWESSDNERMLYQGARGRKRR
jgi:hypothetical protein